MANCWTGELLSGKQCFNLKLSNRNLRLSSQTTSSLSYWRYRGPRTCFLTSLLTSLSISLLSIHSTNLFWNSRWVLNALNTVAREASWMFGWSFTCPKVALSFVNRPGVTRRRENSLIGSLWASVSGSFQWISRILPNFWKNKMNFYAHDFRWFTEMIFGKTRVVTAFAVELIRLTSSVEHINTPLDGF